MESFVNSNIVCSSIGVATRSAYEAADTQQRAATSGEIVFSEELFYCYCYNSTREKASRHFHAIEVSDANDSSELTQSDPVRRYQRLQSLEILPVPAKHQQNLGTNLGISLDTRLGVYRGCRVGSTTTRQDFEFRRVICFLSFSVCSFTSNRTRRIHVLSGMASSVL